MDPKGGPQRSSDIYISRTSDKWISHQLSGHLSTRRKCEGEFRYLSQTLTRLPTSLHQTFALGQSVWSTGFNTPNPSLNGSPAPKSKISGAWRSVILCPSWTVLIHLDPLSFHDFFQDGSKTVQESKPLHIRNRTGPESEKYWIV